MNTKNYLKIGITIVAVSFCWTLTRAEVRERGNMWTDRSLTNPPLSTQTNINASVERFWDLPDESGATRNHSEPHRSIVTPASKRGSLKQKRETRERRGYFGINLFNLIPLVDIVHGDVITESVDRVEERK